MRNLSECIQDNSRERKKKFHGVEAGFRCSCLETGGKCPMSQTTWRTRGRPRSGNDANLYAEELCYFERKKCIHIVR